MSRKVLTLLVVPHDEGNVRRLRISYHALKIGGGVAALVLAVLLGAALSWGRVAARATQATMLERENERLSAENEKAQEIAENLERAEAALSQIRRMAGLPDEEAVEGEGDGAALDAAGGGDDPAAPPPAPARVEPGVPAGWPLTVRGFVTAGFSGREGHPGVDIAVPSDTPVLATAEGRVRQRGFDPVYGHFVILDHPGGIQTMYAHNASILAERDARVTRGETIAYSGNSGRSSAPHLHYEVREGGEAVDPAPYLR